MAFEPKLGYGDATSTTHAVVAVDLSTLREATKREIQAEITAVTTSVVVKFGNSASVEANATLTNDAFADGNFHCQAGTSKLVRVPAGTTHFSHEALSGTGTIYINFGYGERI